MEEDPLAVKEELIDEDEPMAPDLPAVLVKQELEDLIDDYDEEINPTYDENDLESSEDDEEEEEEEEEYESYSEENSDTEYVYKNERRGRRKKEVNYGDLDEDDTGDGISCKGCNRTFRSQPNLNKHLGHFRACKQVYEDSGELPPTLSHQRKKPSDSGDGDYECQKCGRKFVSEGGLNKHVSKIKPCKKHYESLNGTSQINTDGLTPRQSYYARNREKVIARQRAYYHRNAHRVKERRIQYYRSKIVASLLESGEGVNKKASGYMERHREYYEKNKETIKERRRSYYHIKKEALSRKVGKHEFAKISAVKNLAEIPEPYEAYGKVKINIPPPLPPIKALKKTSKIEDEEEEDEEVEGASKTHSPLQDCLDFQNVKSPGASKIRHEDDLENDLITMPVGTVMSPRPFDYGYVQNVESFVGLTLSNDGESVEVCHLLEKNDITLEAMRSLFHALLSVISVDMKTFVQEKSCPVHLFEVKHMHLLKDKLTRDLIETNNKLPEASRPSCLPASSMETDFIDEGMSQEIPHEQLLVNENLVACDLGSIGVQWRLPDDPAQIRINPLFSVNSVDHWRFRLRHLYTLLVNWVGGKIVLNQIMHMLPCMITAKESFFDEVRVECHNELLKPMETKICEHCGEVFQFSKYTLQTRRAYARHVQLHEHNCKICGESFPNGTQRKFHERSHKEHSVKCPHEHCHYVGSSQQAVDTHVKHAHSTLVCDLCGKVTVAQNLKLHMATHHAPKTFEFICAICGKGYSTKNILDKHLKRHNNPDSLINKWMTEPSEFKFECKEHDNCKRFFKSEKRLKEHLKKYGGRPYPANLARQYVPNLPENHSSVVDSTNIQMEKAPKKANKGGGGKKKNEKAKNLTKKKKEEKDVVKAESPLLTEDNSTSDSLYQPPHNVMNDLRNQHLYQHLYPGHPMMMNPEMYQQRTFRPFPSADLGGPHASSAAAAASTQQHHTNY